MAKYTDYRQLEITILRQNYDALVRQRVQIQERMEDIRERLEELGVEP